MPNSKLRFLGFYVVPTGTFSLVPYDFDRDLLDQSTKFGTVTS